MKDQDKTKEQLINELARLQQRVGGWVAGKPDVQAPSATLTLTATNQQNVLDCLMEHVVYHDLDMRILWANRTACASIGMQRKQLVGRHCYEIWAKRPTPCEGCPVKLSRETGRPQVLEKKTPDGRSWYIQGVPVLDVAGNVAGMIELTKEITERVEAEEALTKAHLALERRIMDRTSDLESVNEQLRLEIEEHKKTEKALREQKDFLYTLIETIPSPVFYKDGQGRYTGCNSAFEEFTGRPRSDIVGKTVFDMGPAEIAEKYHQKDQQLFHTPGKQHYEWQVQRTDGALRDVLFDKATLMDTNGNVAGLVGVITDITERKRFEQQLRESEEFSTSLRSHSPNPIHVLNPDTSIRYVNPAFEKLTGFSFSDLIGKKAPYPWWRREEMDATLAEFKKALQIGLNRYEKLFQAKNGDHFWVEITSATVKEDGKLKYYLSNWIDITERKKTEAQIKNLSQQLLKAQENERQMISRELHDSVAQELSILKIALETLFDPEPSVSAEYRHKMSELSRLLDRAIGTVRNLSYDLRPPGMKEIGLIQTLATYCEEFAAISGINVDFQASGLTDTVLDFFIQINIYRLVQEGLNNIRKHAEASQVAISLVGAHPNIILVIEDNGKGFDVKARERVLDDEKRLGLRSMKERVSLLQGQMMIQSRPMRGTKIHIKFPNRKA